MIFHLQQVHVQLDSGFEELAAEKFARLERFFSAEPEVHLIIKKEKFEFTIEAKIQCKRSKTFMKTSSNNVNAGLEDLINKLKNHLSKVHDRKHNKKNKKYDRKSLYSEFSTNTNEIEEEQI
ncbi:MAG: HPF/RaiA family ribosome-associated protein [Candidatus Omnitrophica bacterium]|nr:HPF/RaiA family ribosome-associated protein [Candidatus Omnitrophota bacterium]